MLTLFYIYMRHRGKVTVVLREVKADEVDDLVSVLNLLSDDGELYYREPMLMGVN